MQTIYTLKSAKEASKYYNQGDYYVKDNKQNKSYCIWQGKGAQLLGLQNDVNTTQFQQALNGIFPDGAQMLQKQQGRPHRPGYDLTFSAPKSVSILGIVGQDERVIAAHRKAVSTVLHHIEEKYAAVRIKKNRVIHIEKTDNLTFATFEHTDSRELDPNLHTHCILMNFTQRKDSQWRTIYADPLYSDKILNGMEYRAALAKELMAAGFELVQTSEKGTFELANFDERLIRQFSKRRHQIEEKLNEMGQSGGKSAKMANFLTRQRKLHIDPEHIQLRWEHEIRECGLNGDWLKNYSQAAKERGPVIPHDVTSVVTKALESAINHLSEKKRVFSIKEVLKTARGMTITHCDTTDLWQHLQTKLTDGTLLSLEEGWLTTPLAKEEELTFIENFNQDKNQVKPLCGQFEAAVTTKFRLRDKNQGEVLKTLLTSPHRQTVMQAATGEGYYKVLKALNKTCQEHHYYPIGIVSVKQRQEFSEQTGITRAYNIQGFLEACEKRFEKTKGQVISTHKKKAARQVWIVDPTTPMQVKQALALQQWAKHFGARVLWIGDRISHPLSLVMKEATCGLDKSAKAQKNEKISLLQMLTQQHVCIDAFAQIQERLQQAAESYVTLKSASGATALFVTTHTDRLALNQVVRQKLISTGALGKETTQIPVLRQIPLSKEQKQHLHTYQPDDIIHFKGNSYYRIESIDFQNKTLMLENHIGEMSAWHIEKASTKQASLYRQEARELRLNDEITWTKTIIDKNDEAFNRYAGDTAKVVSLGEKGFSVCLQNGKEFYVNTTSLEQLHVEYAYAALLPEGAHQHSGQNILVMTSNQSDLVEHEALISLIGQSKQVHLLCDDKRVLEGHLQQERAPHFATQEKVIVDDKIRQSFLERDAPLSGPFYRLRQDLEKEGNDDTALTRLSISGPEKIACEAVDYVCHRLIDRNAVFPLVQALEDAYQLVGLSISKEAINAAFQLAFQHKLLVSVGDLPTRIKGLDHTQFVTTQSMIKMEKEFLSWVQQEQDRVGAILASDHPALTTVEGNEKLTQGQKEAILLSLTTTDRVIGIQGVAGAGKTTLLKEVNRIAIDAGFQILGLAHTASAKNRIEEATTSLGEAGISAMTLRKFLNHAEKLLNKEPELAKTLYGANRIFVLDEASMVSTRDMCSVFSTIKRLDARLILMGDVKQLGAIEAGNPWHMLLGSNMKSVSMRENVRFKDRQTVEIMRDLYAARVDDAMEKLAINTLEVPSWGERIKTVAHLYVGRTPQEQAQTLVVAPKNEDRVAINDEIRALLKEKGILTGPEMRQWVLLPKEMTETEKHHFYHYEVGDFIRFNFKINRLGIEAGDYFEIDKKNANTQLLSLKAVDDRILLWSPKTLPKWSGAIEVFEERFREVMVGDKIRWRKNDPARNIINGEVVEVIKVEENTMEVRSRNGDKMELNLKERANQHWDHAYSATVFVAQGQDVKYTIGLCQGPKPYVNKKGKSYYPPMSERKEHELPLSTTLSGFLVQATRGDDFIMVVDNVASFKGTLRWQPGLKEAAMQYLDPEWAQMARKVEDMTANVTGKALGKKETLKSEPLPLKPSSIPLVTPQKKELYPQKEAVIQYLHANVLNQVTSWLGKPSHVTQREARWGKKGSFSVLLSGKAAGTWSDFERGANGRDLLSLYMDTHQVSFKEALKQLSSEVPVYLEPKMRPTKQNSHAFDNNDKQSKIAFAKKTYERGVPIKGTLAEKYLKEHRGITGELPADFRYCAALKHPHTQQYAPALLAPIRDKDQRFIGVVRIFLNPDGSKLNATIKDFTGKEMKAPSKANLGVAKGGAVTVQQGTLPHTLWVAEGVETALSVAKARPHETVMASLSVSQLKGVPIDAEKQKIVICADNDGEHSNTSKVISEAVDQHLKHGHRVFIAMPPGTEKCDFNDVLKREGLQAVQRVLEQKIELTESKQLDQTLSHLRSFFLSISIVTNRNPPKSYQPVKQGVKEFL